MRHSTAEQRVARRLGIAHVRVEVVARQRREPLDVLDRDLAFGGFERVAQLQPVEGNAKRMHLGVAQPAAPDPAAAVHAVIVSGEPCSAVRCM